MASPTHSSSSSSLSDTVLDALQPASIAVVQTVNISSHVPILLDLLDPNYSQWRCFFDTVLDDLVKSPMPIEQRTAEWRQIDCCLVNWLYTTVNKNVFDIIYNPRASAFSVWTDIEGLFRDHKLQRAVLEAEFRSLNQGNLSISDYGSHLKQLSDGLRDVGQPVSEPNQVLNLLRGLNRKYHHVKPVITSKNHTFMSAHSYLLLEEIQLAHDDKVEAGQTFTAYHSSSAGHSGGSKPLNFSVINRRLINPCHHCHLGKHVRLPFFPSETPIYFPFQLVHSDVWTSPVYSHSGYKYYVLLDANTHYIWSFPIRNKSDVQAIIRSFFSYVHTQFRLPILALQTDNGKEFDTHAMRHFLAAQGTSFRLSCPYFSWKNGKAD
ncbi:uncharacterized protein [Setaria viridis]|uniref:uncharacterized protein n=1 Tax=Setaria viridis TaxID=4556 RepID=UPI003B3A68DC